MTGVQGAMQSISELQYEDFCKEVLGSDPSRLPPAPSFYTELSSTSSAPVSISRLWMISEMSSSLAFLLRSA